MRYGEVGDVSNIKNKLNLVPNCETKIWRQQQVLDVDYPRALDPDFASYSARIMIGYRYYTNKVHLIDQILYNLNLYYLIMQVDIEEEYLVYDFKAFVADFGGYLGLLLGGSIISIPSFMELLESLINKMKTQKSSRTVTETW